jgi:hypothetical protein
LKTRIVTLTLLILFGFYQTVNATQPDEIRMNQRVFHPYFGVGTITQMAPDIKIVFDSGTSEVQLNSEDLLDLEISVDHYYLGNFKIERGINWVVPGIGNCKIGEVFSKGTLLLYSDGKPYYFAPKVQSEVESKKNELRSSQKDEEPHVRLSAPELYAKKHKIPYAEFMVSSYKSAAELTDKIINTLRATPETVINLVYDRESSHDLFLEVADYLSRYTQIEISARVIIFETQKRNGQYNGSLKIPTIQPVCNSALSKKSKI